MNDFLLRPLKLGHLFIKESMPFKYFILALIVYFLLGRISLFAQCQLTPSFDQYVWALDDSGADLNWKDYDIGELTLNDNGNGTLLLTGSIINGRDADWHTSTATSCGIQDEWNVSLTLSDVQAWAEFQGSYVVDENCPSAYTGLDYWAVSGTLTGIGCNAGRTININAASSGYRLQIGWGGNSQSCNFGFSTWFDASENGQKVYADIYAHLDESCYTTLRPSGIPTAQPNDYSYNCSDGVEVECIADGAKGQSVTTLNVPNSGNVFQIVAEIVYKGSNPGSSIMIDIDGSSYVLDRFIPSGNSSNVYVYRGLISGSGSTITYTDFNFNSSLQSVKLYVFRNTPTDQEQSGIFTYLSGYNDILNFNIPLPTQSFVRDVVVKVPLSELTMDGRYITLTAEAGGVSRTVTQFYKDPNDPFGCCFNEIAISLNGVPGSASQVNFTVDTRNPGNGGQQTVNGQSYTIAGAVTVLSSCFDCPAEKIVIDIWNDDASCIDKGGLCGDARFTSTDNSSWTDVATFQDPICDPNNCFDQVIVTIYSAASDLNKTRDPAFVNQVNRSYPIEINGVQIGTVNPTEVAYTCYACEPTPTYTFNVTPADVNYNYNGTNTIDLNFLEVNNSATYPQDICVAWVELDFKVVQCRPVCTTPTANDDGGGSFNACPNETVNGNVSTNDLNLSSPTYSLINDVSEGNLTFNNNGTFTYAPNQDFCGEDQFTYRVCNDGQTEPECCDEATVVISVSEDQNPVLQNIPPNTTVECDQIPAIPGNVTATDNCAGNLSLNFYEEISLTSNGNGQECGCGPNILTNGGLEQHSSSLTFSNNFQGNPAEDIENGEDDAITGWRPGLSYPRAFYIDDTQNRVNNPEGDYFMWFPGQWDCWVSKYSFLNNPNLEEGKIYTLCFDVAPWNVSLDANGFPDGGSVSQGTGGVQIELKFEDGSVHTVKTWDNIAASSSWTNLNWTTLTYSFRVSNASKIKTFYLTNRKDHGLAFDNFKIAESCTDIPGECFQEYTIWRTWTAQDICENKAKKTQIITVEDNTPPIITPPANDTVMVECDGNGNQAELQAWLDNHGGATAVDNCGNVTWTYDFDFNQFLFECGGEGWGFATFYAEDDCGNRSPYRGIFKILDTTKPNITTPASDATFECDGNGNTADINAWLADNGGARGNDICSPFHWEHNYFGLTNDCGATGMAEVTFKIIDDCGNERTTTATVRIEDTKDPVVTCNPEDKVHECTSDNEAVANAWNTANIARLEACSSDDCGFVTVQSDFDYRDLSDLCGSTGSFEVTYTITDECGRSVTKRATFTVDDNTPPSPVCQDITVQLDENGLASITPEMIDNGSNDVCGNVTLVSVEPNNFNTTQCGTRVPVTLTVRDDCGNESTCTANVKVECFDLALRKVLGPGENTRVFPNDDITFRIHVFNQGSLDASNIKITDYIPTGLALNDNDWNSNNNTFTIPFLAAGDETFVDITLNATQQTPGTIINIAEIRSAEAPTGFAPDDIDSQTDNNPTNDAGGANNQPSDDAIDGDGTGAPGSFDPTTDEDDADPEDIVIGNFDLALRKEYLDTKPFKTRRNGYFHHYCFQSGNSWCK